MTTEGNGVNYSVKELLNRMDAKLDAISLKLEGKAERQSVHELAGRVSALELRLQATSPLAQTVERIDGRLVTLELDQAGRKTLSNWQRVWLGSFAISLLTAVATLVWLIHG